MDGPIGAGKREIFVRTLGRCGIMPVMQDDSASQGDQEPLPQDLDACHAMIRRLRAELIGTRRQLAVHEENQRRQFEHLYGKGFSFKSVLGFGQAMAKAMEKVDEQAIADELAAEDAMRRRRRRKR